MKSEEYGVVYDLSTEYMLDEIEKCEDIAELREYIERNLRPRQEQWAEKIRSILLESRYNKSGFAEACGITRRTLDKWLNGSIPKSREAFLVIGLAARYNIEQMNQLLQRYGQYPALYSKILEDCVCIYTIENFEKERVEKYRYILNSIKERLAPDRTEGLIDTVSTVKLDNKIKGVRGEDELDRFIFDNTAIFGRAYHKLYAYVKMNLIENYNGLGTVSDLADAQGWSSSLRICVSEINQRKWHPTRNKIISLGLHLSMDHEQVDEMLRLAHMEPLCAKNIFESIVIFILEDAKLNDMIGNNDENGDPDELLKYAKDVMSRLKLPEAEDFINELKGIDDEL